MAMSVNVVAGGDVLPNVLVPQHSARPSDRNAHAALRPTRTFVNVPTGFVALTMGSAELPQHEIAPARLIAHPAPSC
jgi:hypothetical protein